MKTKSSAKCALCMAVVMAVSGCRTPAAMGSRGLSASDTGASAAGDSSQGSDSGSGDSSQGDSSKSGSGDSSQGDSSKSESGDSSQGNSSEEGGSSDSGGSSESKSSESDGSSDSHSGSSERTSRSSEEGGSSEGSSGTEKAEGEASRSNSDNSSHSNNDNVVSAVTVGVVVVGLGVVIWQAYAAVERRRGVAPKELGRSAQVYLRSRTHQLREDLALGAGPTVEDLAAAAHIRRENLGTFGRVLRAHRQELLAMADARTLTPARALAWMERVGELASADPRLDEDRRAFLLSAPGGAETAEVAH
ncbi:hypothetical protein [Pyxidicoccus sp. MSG2]|uniref:hypothetical protein n=1 Tax=Pyxidicoccus sp. MSG2 TaxID=2996790 RepID=UPI00226EBD7D|nr:hypothetical protein [Pyxidicoccus sp. MSG2]MCY1019050.1 hypothetical protein [Pyxidicoccus sp. MSG2]